MLSNLVQRGVRFAVLIAACIAATIAPPALAQESTWDRVIRTKELRIGAAPTEPWFLKDTSNSTLPGAVKSGDDTWRGVGPMLGKEIADAMGVKLTIVETTWANAVAGLQANQFDVMFMLDPTPARAMAVAFVWPLLWSPYAMIARDDLVITNWSDLNDPKFRVATVSGTAPDALMTKFAPRATVSRFGSTGEAIAAFQSGRVDGALTTSQTADTTRARLRMGKTLVLKPVTAMPTGAAMRKEADRRWQDYLHVAVHYNYNVGKIQEFYEQFVAFRGLDPKQVAPVMREAW